MTRRPGRPALFASAAAAVVLYRGTLGLTGMLPWWDTVANALDQLLTLGVGHVLLRGADQDTAQMLDALAGLVRADPGVPDALAPDGE